MARTLIAALFVIAVEAEWVMSRHRLNEETLLRRRARGARPTGAAEASGTRGRRRCTASGWSVASDEADGLGRLGPLTETGRKSRHDHAVQHLGPEVLKGTG